MSTEPKNIAANPKIQSYYDYNAFLSNETVRAYYHRFSEYGAMSKHYHHFPELNVVIRGTGTHFLGDKVYKVKPGDIFVIPPLVNHAYDFGNQNFIIYHILFKTDFFEKYSQILKYIAGYNVFFELEPVTRTSSKSYNTLTNLAPDVFKDLKGDFARLAELEIKTGNDVSQEEKELFTLYIISKICKNVVVDQNADSDTSELFQIMKSLEYMQKNFSEKISVDELARKASMSKSTFFRFFDKYYGTTPIEYLNNYRILMAKKMLVETNKSAVNIAQDCGFFDSSHFIKQFRAVEGTTPVKYRKEHRK